MSRAWRHVLAVLLAVLSFLPAVALLPALAAPHDRDEPAWKEVLTRAARSTSSTRYAGEVLWVTWNGDHPQVARFAVRNVGGRLHVSSPDRTVVVGRGGGGVVDHDEGWYVPLPGASLLPPLNELSVLEDKYDVTLVGIDRLLDRQTSVVELRRRADGMLRERLWVDEETALLLRRETYQGERLLRLVVYLSLDLSPPRAPNGAPSVGPHRPVPLQAWQQGLVPVGAVGLEALREAGWTVPDVLPGGYEPVAVYAVSTAQSQPLQVVYRDGLYAVSLFQQPGRLDRKSLPSGAEPATGLGWPAYTWPGAVPHRMVWEADGSTYFLVGDAPPEEFRRLAEALPRPRPPGLVQRMRRGLGRLWSLVSPW